MNYTLPNSLSTNLYKLRKEDILSDKYIGAPLTNEPIKEYDVFGRLKPTNNPQHHVAGYNNFFGYKHPQTEPPNWWAPCFDNKQIRMQLHKF